MWYELSPFCAPFLKRASYTIQTDHDALQWILTKAEATEKLARRPSRLSVFEFHIVHRARVGYQVPDTLSRLKKKVEDKTLLEDKVATLSILQMIVTCVPKM